MAEKYGHLIFIGLWCNGSIGASKAFGLGSSPSRPANKVNTIMRLDEVIVNFPKQLTTKKGTVRKSGVIGKSPTGEYVYADEFTGIPYVVNRMNTRYAVDPETYELPDDYDPNYKEPDLWYVRDRYEGTAYSGPMDYEAARTEARRQRRWLNKANAEIAPFN